ncbi:DUF4190 domain-containing protein [Streptomyces liangshanensis]|uniref:DUF4190 domain-containing protein n=1 Tax=Streptomyces liangshanensis TaxID=2717324 RepID=A0A6G9GT45_9ACTN|nr:DUF4190 domain-containing protein [Streptomyces liangshanensis]QIQ01246.1 DUF4190 domain-containing protein [Streptomyces liangshanensis]
MSMPHYPQQSAPEGQPHTGPVPHTDPAPARGNNLAIAALVLGIAACVFFWTVVGGIVLGLAAVVLGILGARRARGGRAPRRTMAIVGAVLGGLGLIVSAVIVTIGVSLLNSDEFKDFNDCVRHANSQSEKDRCADDYKQDVNN